MFEFKPITEDLLAFVMEIVNSNSYYNMLENGNAYRTIEEVRSEFLNEVTDSYLIVLENKYIGIIDFLKNNPKDNCPWIGLLMIHGDNHFKGYGKKVYASFEERLKKQNFSKLRIGILSNNIRAKEYWISLGFKFYENSKWEGKLVGCFEKSLI